MNLFFYCLGKLLVSYGSNSFGNHVITNLIKNQYTHRVCVFTAVIQQWSSERHATNFIDSLSTVLTGTPPLSNHKSIAVVTFVVVHVVVTYTVSRQWSENRFSWQNIRQVCELLKKKTKTNHNQYNAVRFVRKPITVRRNRAEV